MRYLFYAIPTEAIVFLNIALVATLGAIVFIFFLLSSRIIKNSKLRKESFLRARFQQSLNVILQMDLSTDDLEASTQFFFSQLTSDMGSSRLAKQVMVDQLIGLRKSLAGSAADNLTNVYVKLKLDEFSTKKLYSIQWQKRAQGISELSQMGIENAIKKIRGLLQAKNVTIREEALFGLVKLDKDKSLSFLDDYKAPLSSWMVMRIHQQLSVADKRLLPNFSRWYKHENLDVVLFAIEMTKQFRQIGNASKLIALFNDAELRKVAAAIEACGELEPFGIGNDLAGVVEKYWDDNLISLNLVRSLGKVAYEDLHWQKIASYLNHPNYLVKLEAAKVLNSSMEKTKLLLTNIQESSHGILDSLVRHVNDPLLQS